MDGNNETSDLTGCAPAESELHLAGGDAPGMNAAIRAVARIAAVAGIEVIGFRRGYEGLEFATLPSRFALVPSPEIIQRGGTFLETSRSVEFRTPAARGLAARNLKLHWTNPGAHRRRRRGLDDWRDSLRRRGRHPSLRHPGLDSQSHLRHRLLNSRSIPRATRRSRPSRPHPGHRIRLRTRLLC